MNEVRTYGKDFKRLTNIPVKPKFELSDH